MGRLRQKQQIPAMLPKKKWLSKTEAMAYMDLGLTAFEQLVKAGELTTSYPTGGDRAYFQVDEIDNLFKRKITLKTIAV